MTSHDEPAAGRTAWRASLRDAFVSLALFGLALGIRLLPAPYVWLPDRVLFFGYDAYYHMRRVVYTVAHFPETLGFDLYINYPEGARPIWTPLFDWLLAAAIRPFRGHLGLHELELVASCAPPLLGALAVVALHRTVRPRFGAAAAALAAFVLALLPAHAWYSQVGFVDHHCAVALMAVLLLGAGMRFVEGARGSATALGVALGLSLLLWPGMLLHVAIVTAVIATSVALAASREQAVADARRLARSLAVALLLVAPVGLTSQWPQWSAASPVVLSRFQPWLFASGAGAALAAAGAWQRWPAAAARPWPRALSGLGAALGVALVLAWLVPGLFAGFVEAWQWMSRTDAFQHLVGESRPLLRDAGGAFHLWPGINNLSAFVLVMPLALVLGARAAQQSPRPAPLVLVLVFAAVTLAAALAQRRFANSASIGVALVLALSVRGLHARLRRRTRRPWPRAVGMAALGAATLAALAPGLLGFAPEVDRLLRPPGGVALVGQRYEWYALYDTALWLRDHTPQTSGWLDRHRAPEYAVAGPWDAGHVVEYVARRPTATDNFGDDLGARNFALVEAYFTGDEATGVAILERLGVRYVIVPHYTSFLATAPGPDSLYRALYERDGRDALPPDGRPGTGGPQPALAHHRLVYEHTRTAVGAAERPPFKVFEHVAGARLTGRTTPGAEVRGRIDVFGPGGRAFEYAARTRADTAGRYLLVLPYASGVADGAVRTSATYTLSCGSRAVPWPVPEGAVRRGATLRGPDPCAPPVQSTPVGEGVGQVEGRDAGSTAR